MAIFSPLKYGKDGGGGYGVTVGDITLGVAAGGAPARASCGPCFGDPFVEDYRISVDDCDAHHNFHVFKEDKTRHGLLGGYQSALSPPITFTETDPRAAP